MRVDLRTIDKVSILPVVLILWRHGGLMASVLGFELSLKTFCCVLGQERKSQIASLHPGV